MSIVALLMLASQSPSHAVTVAATMGILAIVAMFYRPFAKNKNIRRRVRLRIGKLVHLDAEDWPGGPPASSPSSRAKTAR